MEESFIIADSEKTSVAVHTIPRESEASVKDPGTKIWQSLAERYFHFRKDLVLVKGEHQQTGRSSSIKANLCIFTGDILVGLTTFKTDSDCFIKRQDILTYSSAIKGTAPEGPSRESWTVSTWALINLPPIREALTNLENLVANLKRLSVPQRSSELVQLAHRAVEAMSSREKEDIVEWARRLAEDTTKVDD